MFVRGSTELLPGQEASLRAFARTIPPEFTLAVHGMASEEGPGPYNRSLSRHRAERVIAILDESGVPQSRVAVILVHGAVPGDRPRHRAVVIDMTPPPTREPSLTPEPVPEDKPGITPLDVIKQVAPSDVGMKFEEEFTYPTKGYRPAGPIMWRLKLKFSFDGAVTMGSSDLEQQRAIMDQLETKILDIVSAKSTKPRSYFARKWKNKEWMIDAEEAEKLGLVDRIEE